MIIYKVTNLINNKIYIGQTNGNQLSYRGSGVVIKLAHKKYGKSNFKFETLIEGDFNQELTDLLETEYIEMFNSTNRNIGYNISLGGTGKFTKRSEEFKIKCKINAKITKNALGSKRTLECKEKMSILKKGKKLTKEHIENIKISKLKNPKIYKFIPRINKRKSIICLNIETNETLIFDSAINASKELNIGRTSITNNLKQWSSIVNKKYKFKYNAKFKF